MDKAKIFYNGVLIGFHPKPEEFAKEVRKLRREGKIPREVNVAYYKDLNEVYINADEGRVVRPLIVVENGKPKLTQEHIRLLREGKIKFSDLIKSGVIEYVDAEEEENIYIALKPEDLTPEHTHLELYPALILGIAASCLPYPEHNDPPRTLMGVKMLKQALGTYAYNFLIRMDTQAHIMHYPQKPIVETKFYKIVGLDKKPAGQNFVVAIIPYYGYNQNDAVVMNKSSIERGLARTTYYRTYDTKELRYPGGQKDQFGIPKPEVIGYRGEDAYKYLDQDGIIELETFVKENDVLVGKTSPPRFLEEIKELGVLEEKRRENSLVVKGGEQGYVDTILATEGEGGNRVIRVRIRHTMIPEIGDKFASRHAQKGVIGLLVDQRDMPFSESGVIPDLCMNPISVPSRMTIGHLLELISGKVGALSGRFVDATAFDHEPEEVIKEELRKHGFKPTGKEILYDGITGEEYEAEIFTGIIYYERLKHLVAHKMHARARGPVQILTRQPTEGRAREGGLRLGEMERDTFIGHGAASLLHERLLEEADKTMVYVCKHCGVIAIEDHIRKRKFCPLCGGTDVYPVEMSYSFKLLLHELMAIGIYPKLKLGDKI